MSDPPPKPTRLEQVITELAKERALIDSNQPCIIRIQCFPDELKVEVSKVYNVKLVA